VRPRIEIERADKPAEIKCRPFTGRGRLAHACQRQQQAGDIEADENRRNRKNSAGQVAFVNQRAADDDAENAHHIHPAARCGLLAGGNDIGDQPGIGPGGPVPPERTATKACWVAEKRLVGSG
jgi:hypothetical protein